MPDFLAPLHSATYLPLPRTLAYLATIAINHMRNSFLLFIHIHSLFSPGNRTSIPFIKDVAKVKIVCRVFNFFRLQIKPYRALKPLWLKNFPSPQTRNGHEKPFRIKTRPTQFPRQFPPNHRMKQSLYHSNIPNIANTRREINLRKKPRMKSNHQGQHSHMKNN